MADTLALNTRTESVQQYWK